jgi:hypothetical protein
MLLGLSSLVFPSYLIPGLWGTSIKISDFTPPQDFGGVKWKKMEDFVWSDPATNE